MLKGRRRVLGWPSFEHFFKWVNRKCWKIRFSKCWILGTTLRNLIFDEKSVGQDAWGRLMPHLKMTFFLFVFFLSKFHNLIKIFSFFQAVITENREFHTCHVKHLNCFNNLIEEANDLVLFRVTFQDYRSSATCDAVSSIDMRLILRMVTVFTHCILVGVRI